MLDLSKLTAINPVDGRYEDQTKELRGICSEFGLMRLRVKVELAWFKKLSDCECWMNSPFFIRGRESAGSDRDDIFSK